MKPDQQSAYSYNEQNMEESGGLRPLAWGGNVDED